MTTTPSTINISQFIIDDALQPRCEGVDEAHVRALVEVPDSWPPVAIVQNAQGERILVDGFHRLEAARRLGLATIPARVIEFPCDGDLFRLAFELNAAHGKPLSLADRKAYARRLIGSQPNLSDREIGRRTGIHHETVGALRSENRDPQTQPSYTVPSRKLGEIESDIPLFDGIRFAKATREQKCVAGYIKRLAAALGDPYPADDGDDALPGWSDNPGEIAQSCIAAMGEKGATTLFSTLKHDAQFLIAISNACFTHINRKD